MREPVQGSRNWSAANGNEGGSRMAWERVLSSSRTLIGAQTSAHGLENRGRRPHGSKYDACRQHRKNFAKSPRVYKFTLTRSGVIHRNFYVPRLAVPIRGQRIESLLTGVWVVAHWFG